MKKMIFSDLLQARSTLPFQIAICTILGCIFGIMMENAGLAVSMPMAVFAFGHCIGMPLWDESHDWQLMRFAMPFSRREIVLGRYATGVLFLLIGLFCSLLALGIVYAATALGMVNIEAAPIQELAMAFMGVSACILLICSVMFTVGFGFGYQKAGKWIPVICAIGVGIFVAVGGNFLDQPGVVETIEAMPLINIFGGALAVAAVVYIATIFLSIRLYEKRSF